MRLVRVDDLLVNHCILFLHLATQPQVTSHPESPTLVVPGSDMQFSVTATGTAALSYQWQKDGVNLTDGGRIKGASTSTLSITAVQKSDEGRYRSVVTNIAGTDTSTSSKLTLGKYLSIIIVSA